MKTAFRDGSRILLAFWTLLALGSCSVTVLKRTDINIADGDVCLNVSADHSDRPRLPNIDPRQYSEEELIDMLLGHAEAMNRYLDQDHPRVVPCTTPVL